MRHTDNGVRGDRGAARDLPPRRSSLRPRSPAPVVRPAQAGPSCSMARRRWTPRSFCRSARIPARSRRPTPRTQDQRLRDHLLTERMKRAASCRRRRLFGPSNAIPIRIIRRPSGIGRKNSTPPVPTSAHPAIVRIGPGAVWGGRLGVPRPGIPLGARCAASTGSGVREVGMQWLRRSLTGVPAPRSARSPVPSSLVLGVSGPRCGSASARPTAETSLCRTVPPASRRSRSIAATASSARPAHRHDRHSRPDAEANPWTLRTNDATREGGPCSVDDPSDARSDRRVASLPSLPCRGS
jgi:hypothetical protein